MAAAEWLAAKSRSYHQDARRMETDPALRELVAERTCGMTAGQWAIVYRAIAEELNKCAKEAACDHAANFQDGDNWRCLTCAHVWPVASDPAGVNP